jgi:hypothetical protein
MSWQRFGGPHWLSEVHSWHCPVLSQTPLQEPHSSMLPQPSGQVPHAWPSKAHVVGVQHDPLSQVWPAGQEPPSSMPPQPSDQVPHVWPSEPQVSHGAQLLPPLQYMPGQPWRIVDVIDSAGSVGAGDASRADAAHPVAGPRRGG